MKIVLACLLLCVAAQAQPYAKPVPARVVNDTLHPHTLVLRDTLIVPDSVRWDDLVAPALTGKAPTSGAAVVNEDSLTLDYSATQTNTAFFVFQLSHATIQDTAYDLNLHVHWKCADTGVVVWNVIYSISNIGGGSSAFAVSARRVNVWEYAGTPFHQITSVLLIPSESVGPSSIVRVKLQRLGGDALDTYPALVRVKSVDIHYPRHTEGGSKTETNRYP